MRIVYLVFLMVSTSACTTASSTSTSMSDGTTAYVVRCENGWPDCYVSAQQVCGKAGFTEIDRLADGRTSSAGRLERRHGIEGGVENQVYSENPREEIFGRVLTFRCNSPVQEP